MSLWIHLHSFPWCHNVSQGQGKVNSGQDKRIGQTGVLELKWMGGYSKRMIFLSNYIVHISPHSPILFCFEYAWVGYWFSCTALQDTHQDTLFIYCEENLWNNKQTGNNRWSGGQSATGYDSKCLFESLMTNFSLSKTEEILFSKTAFTERVSKASRHVRIKDLYNILPSVLPLFGLVFKAT